MNFWYTKQQMNINNVICYWVGQKVCLDFFRKIKDTFFIFTNNLINLDIFSMSAIPHMHNADCSQLMSQFDWYQLQLVYPTVEHHPVTNLPLVILGTMFWGKRHCFHFAEGWGTEWCVKLPKVNLANDFITC